MGERYDPRLKNYVEYECRIPFVRKFAYLDTSTGFVEYIAHKAHTISDMLSPDGEFLVTFCWVFAWDVETFKDQMAFAVTYAGDAYVDECRQLSIFN